MSRGRPCFKPSAEDRRLARDMAAYGASRDEIAAAIGITRKTLSKHLGAAIVDGRSCGQADPVAGLWMKAHRGSVNRHHQVDEFGALIAGRGSLEQYFGARWQARSGPPGYVLPGELDRISPAELHVDIN